MKVTEVTGPLEKSEKLTMDTLTLAARTVFAKLDAQCRDALAAEVEAKAYAAAHKSGMADGYWKPTHEARLRMQAARALLDALEIEQ